MRVGTAQIHLSEDLFNSKHFTALHSPQLAESRDEGYRRTADTEGRILSYTRIFELCLCQPLPLVVQGSAVCDTQVRVLKLKSLGPVWVRVVVGFRRPEKGRYSL